jgi:hypothetical protein
MPILPSIAAILHRFSHFPFPPALSPELMHDPSFVFTADHVVEDKFP